jgi:hypothetical protein
MWCSSAFPFFDSAFLFNSSSTRADVPEPSFRLGRVQLSRAPPCIYVLLY